MSSAPSTLVRHTRSHVRAAAAIAGVTLFAASANLVVASEDTVTVSHGISTFGDLKYPENFPHFDYVNPDAPQGGRMVLRGTGASNTFDSLNSFILKGEPAQGLGLLYDSLMVGSADEPDSSYGLIAESIEYPEDRSWAIFNMRPEATFSDGEPITADDVVFSWRVLTEKGHPVYSISFRDIENVEALEPHKVKFTFAEDAPKRDLPALAGGMSILPEHYYEDVPFEDSTLEPPIGSGAFVVSDAKPGRSITYCRNPDYWAADRPVNVGSSNFECYVYEYFADHTAAFEALKSGEYLFHEEFFSSKWANEYTFPSFNKQWVKRESIDDARPSGTQGFWFNLRREIFSDPRVREAMALMFNFEWSNETLFGGLYERTDSFWENSDMQAEGLPEGEELAVLEKYRDQLPPEVFDEPAYSPPVSSTQQLDRKNIRRASNLLEEAGWTVGSDGMRRNAAGEKLVIEIVDDSPAFERIINPFVTNLRRIGIDARYALIDAAQMQQRQEDFDYDIVPGRLVMGLSPSVELRSTFGSEGADSKGTLNLAGVADPVVDALIEEIIAAETRVELTIRVRALDRILRAKHIWVPNWFKGAYWVAYWDVFGRPENAPPYSRGDAYWWFDEAKYDALKAEGALR